MKFMAVLAIFLVAAVLSSQPAPREQVGPLPDGGFLLNSGWRVRPAGQQLPLDTFPMSSALSKDGRFLFVLNGGYRPPSISVIDLKENRETGRVPVADGWLGLTVSPDGHLLWVGGGSAASIFEFSISGEGVLQPTRRFELVPETQRTHRDFIGDVAVTPDGRLLYAASLYQDQILVVNPSSGTVIERFRTGRRPYRILFHPDGKSYFVSSWADATVYQYQTADGQSLGSVRVGPHPTDMVWRERKTGAEEGAEAPAARLFVSSANTNNLYVLGVGEDKQFRNIETINVSMTPREPLGMTPSALAFNADQSRLYVVCSDANAVAIADVTERWTRVLGFVPAGWYPTAVRGLPDGRLVVLNGRGSGSYPNPHGPNPALRAAPVHEGGKAVEYVARIQTGSVSLIAAPSDEQIETYTSEVLANSPYRDLVLDQHALPPNLGIEHVIYIVKENRTYDQVFGDLGKGTGDPSLVLFREDVSPNHRKLAREFVLFDNFYVNSDVSADGHNWSTAAIAPDYTQKLWPNSYAARRRHYDYEGGEPAATPPAGYLWTNAATRGLSMRNYGYFVTNKKNPAEDSLQVEAVRDPVLRRVTNLNYRGFDLSYPDVSRAKVFLGDLAQFESNNKMPQLIFMRLGNDHTSGTAAGKIAPLSSFADNDYALGMVVEGVSHSKFWRSTAIFVLEDDAQNGPDHIDSHRSIAFVISPWTHTGAIDSSMYNTTSMLRTIELLLGLRPMTHFDAAARPMFAAFGTRAIASPYQAEKPRIPLDTTNPEEQATSAAAARLDFSDADRADDDELNAILWRAIRHSAPPAPVRSLFSR